MENLRIDIIIPDHETIHDIREHLLLLLQLRIFPCIHPVLLTQPLLLFGAEYQREDDIVQDSHGCGGDKKHQYTAHNRPN